MKPASMAPLVIPIVLAHAAIGCEAPPDAPPVPQFQIEDSAGVVIVENPRPEAGSRLGWRVGAEPTLSIGTVEGSEDFQLHRVDDALLLPDGRIVVANAGSYQLLVFDPTGDFLEAWGQRGQGPGDFGGVGGAWGSDGLVTNLFWIERWPGDSLAVCHSTGQTINNVFSVWDVRGRHGRTINLHRGGDLRKCRDVLSDGTIVASRRFDDRPSPLPEKGINRSSLDFFVLAGDGSPLGELGRHPGAEIFWYFESHFGDGTGMGLYEPPFQRTLRWAAWGEFAVVAPTDRYELRAYRRDGSLARIVRRENDVPDPTVADLDDYRAANPPEGDWAANPDLLKRNNATYDAFPLPESFPAFSALEVDALGYLWVREYNLPATRPAPLWTVFDPEGRVQGFVETPEGLVIYEIGEDYIVGKVEDELGVEYVQLWGLERPVG